MFRRGVEHFLKHLTQQLLQSTEVLLPGIVLAWDNKSSLLHPVKRISIRNRLLISLGLILLASFITLEVVTYWQIKASRERAMLQQAQSLRDALISMRRVYQQQFLDSGLPLNDKTIGFLPAHAMGRISEVFSRTNPDGVRFNNVSDRPRNPLHQANARELAVMAYFRAHPDKKYYFQPVALPGKEDHYLYAQPLWVEEFCLKCHGRRSDAPIAIREHYDRAFDYQVGELRGLLTIQIPSSSLRTWENFQATFAVHLALVLALVGLLMFALRIYFSRPLEHVSARLQQFAQGDYQTRAPHLPLEYQSLEQTFNHMAEAVTQRDHALQQAAEELENRVDQRTQELHEALHAKDRFFSIIAHDLKGPISGLANLLKLMEETAEAQAAPPNPLFHGLTRSAETTLALLENLLTWARSQSGRLHLQPREFYLWEEVQSTLALLGEVLRQKEVTLEQEVAPDLVVYADPEIISLVLRNLLSNAVKYSHSGQVVRLAAWPQGSGVTLEVVDHGTGMPPEQVQTLFQIEAKSQPAPGTGGERGTGLGLILVGEFMHKSGGRIGVESSLGQGTKVTLWLPAEPGALPDSP